MSKSNTTTTELLNHVIRGEGEPILLIHGLFGSLENLNMVAKDLASDYQVVSVDVRNHGSSFHHQSMNYEAMANDVVRLIEQLNLKKCHILGHSMGGKIAMQYALTHPELVDKLIVADIAPIEYPKHHNDIIAGLLAIDLTQVKNRQDADKQLATYVIEPGVRQFLLKNLAKTESGFIWKANIENIANDYSQVVKAYQGSAQFTGPTLFIKGGNSNYILADHKEIIGQLFPNSKAKIIQGAGHWLHAEKTVAFNKIVKDFLIA